MLSRYTDGSIREATGSLLDYAKKTGKSMADVWLEVKAVVGCDTSGSMSSDDAGRDDNPGITRYEAMLTDLLELQAQYQGKVAVISFSDIAKFCPNGIPENMGDNTYMETFLEMCMGAGTNLIPDLEHYLLSDGAPNNPDHVLDLAKKFGHKIHTIFIGPEWDTAGREFMEKLAKATGGDSQVIFRAQSKLTGGIAGYLGAPSR